MSPLINYVAHRRTFVIQLQQLNEGWGMTKDKLDSGIHVRINQKCFRELVKKSRKFNGYANVVRELIDAYLEDRLTIEPKSGIILCPSKSKLEN